MARLTPEQRFQANVENKVEAGLILRYISENASNIPPYPLTVLVELTKDSVRKRTLEKYGGKERGRVGPFVSYHADEDAVKKLAQCKFVREISIGPRMTTM